MEPRILLFVVIGLGFAGAAALERPLRRLPVSLPMVYVALGWLVFSLPLGLPRLDPAGEKPHALAAEYLTEFIVIASLMAAGLAIDRTFSWRGWRQAMPLLAVTMPLTILAVAVFGWWAMGLGGAAAILLGAVMAPTDPVLAGAVQVGPPGESGRDDVRFNLTVEAGLNDGLAFPFVYLAIAAAKATGGWSWIGEWAWLDLGWRVLAGVAVGLAVGWGSGWLMAWLSQRAEGEDPEEHPRNEGLVVMAGLLGAYGLAEAVEGYGFLAVFVGAVTARQYERENDYHRETHQFIDQIEKVVMIVMLVGFGGLLAGGALAGLTWQGALLGVLLVGVIRPLSGIAAMLRSGLPWPGRWAVAFLGIRGIGTIYYLAYGQNQASFGNTDPLWATACFTILLSIVVHGVVARRLMGRLEKKDAHVVPGTAPDVLEGEGQSPG